MKKYIAIKILNFIFTISLLFLIILTMFIFSSKSLINKDNVSYYIEDTDILNIDLGILFNSDEKGKTLKQTIIELAVNNNIPEEIISDILKSDEINNILGDFFSSTIDYTLRGENKPSLSLETIQKMKDVASISLEDHINIILEEEQLNSYIDEYVIDLVEIVPQREDIIGDATVETINKIIYFNTSYAFFAILINCLIICIINFSFYKLLKYLGLSMIIAGVSFVIISCFDKVIASNISLKLVNLGNFVYPLVVNIATQIFKYGVLISFTGLFIYMFYVFINRIVINNIINKMLNRKN